MLCGEWLAVAEHGGTLKIWDIAKGIEIHKIEGLTDDQTELKFSPDGARVLGRAKSVPLKIWICDLATDRIMTKTLPDFSNSIRGRFSPDGKRIALVALFGSRFAEVPVLDAETGDEILRLKGHNDSVVNVAFSPDSKRLASCGMDTTVRVWDLASGQETLRLKGHTGNVTSVEFSSDGHRLISAATDGTVRFWDATPVPEDRE
jgi:WD40 repeat protein